ncbi:quinone oxidoreductase [Nitrospira sp.]|nr:quinone oxidoreductase [Nitrospira sp.]
MNTFQALQIHHEQNHERARLVTLRVDDLSPGHVLIAARYSSVNYKDALAVTGHGKIVRRFPLVAGIDVSGVVEASDDPRFRAGEHVLVTGYGLSQDHDGGYAGYVRVPAEWVVPVPEGLGLHEVMALGTAGLTVALAITRMEDNGVRPANGPVVVTGATGGVGCLAVDILAALNYEVVAITGKREASDELVRLGARRIVLRDELEMGRQPLERAQWAGAIDTVGGDVLAWLTRTIFPRGSIASVGLAGGSDLQTTVMPFILRGVSLLGISSANCPMPLRRHCWQRLATDLRPRHLDRIAPETVSLEDVPSVCKRLLAGTHRGRTVVKL